MKPEQKLLIFLFYQKGQFYPYVTWFFFKKSEKFTWSYQIAEICTRASLWYTKRNFHEAISFVFWCFSYKKTFFCLKGPWILHIFPAFVCLGNDVFYYPFLSIAEYIKTQYHKVVEFLRTRSCQEEEVRLLFFKKKNKNRAFGTLYAY